MYTHIHKRFYTQSGQERERERESERSVRGQREAWRRNNSWWWGSLPRTWRPTVCGKRFPRFPRREKPSLALSVPIAPTPNSHSLAFPSHFVAISLCPTKRSPDVVSPLSPTNPREHPTRCPSFASWVYLPTLYTHSQTARWGAIAAADDLWTARDAATSSTNGRRQRCWRNPAGRSTLRTLLISVSSDFCSNKIEGKRRRNVYWRPSDISRSEWDEGWSETNNKK